MTAFSEYVGALLPLLRCPACHSCRTLEIKSGSAKANTSIRLCNKHLLCWDCNVQYPITEDYIPIMWDADLQSIYADANTSNAESVATIDANVAIYDNISDAYNLFSRRDSQIAKRMRNAVRRILDIRRSGLDSSALIDEQSQLYHLDYGCGPGHVIGWLKEFGFLQIGLDVSLKNLRNARKETGCLVVCGNACNMPFANESIDIITESSVLHHIFDWKSAISESIRICNKFGGIVIDSEPSRDQMAWSPLAVMVFNARFPIYKALSYFRRDKYIFRNTDQAKLNVQAEVHHQPGTGFPLDEVEALFTKAGFIVDIVLSPTQELASKGSPGWKGIVLNILSARNPWNPKYGAFTAVSSRNKEPGGRVAPDVMGPSSPKRIYLSPPHMGPDERKLLLDAFDSNWIAPLGHHVDAFEREFCETIGVGHAAALSSGTAALHLALLMSGVGAGDEVLVSSFTFAATANAVTYTGATPVFIDCEPASWNIDPGLLREELESAAKRGKLPKAVIVVDLYGQCADYVPILETCAKYDVPVVEDAAEALGASYRGKPAGSFGKIGVFSFNGNKIITTSGGGMLVSEDAALVERARYLSTQARDPAQHYQHSVIGYNYRLSNLLAAVGRGQLRVLRDRVARKRENFLFYQRALGDLPGVSFMPIAGYGEPNYWLTCILVDPGRFGATREDIRLALEKANIEARPLWKPMHLQPVFKRCKARGGQVSEGIFRDGLCLPSGTALTDVELGRVAGIVRTAFRGKVD